MPPGRRKRRSPRQPQPSRPQGRRQRQQQQQPPQYEAENAEEDEEREPSRGEDAEEEAEEEQTIEEEAEEEEDPATADSEDPTAPRLFNTTFSTHRVSPLHVGARPLTAPRLAVLSARLRDVLVGDVVRGVQIGTGPDAGGSDPALGRAGALERVEWRWIPLRRLMGAEAPPRRGPAVHREASLELGAGDEAGGGARGRGRGRGRRGGARGGRGAGSATVGPSDAADPEEGAREGQDALCLVLAYENATFHALLLPDTSSPGSKRQGAADLPHLPWTGAASRTTRSSTAAGKEGEEEEGRGEAAAFLHLPLLLLKLPAPVKSVLVNFLATTFDCRVSPLRLGTRTLVRCWEDWLAALGRRQQPGKDVSVTLGFHLEPPVDDPAREKPTDGRAGGTRGRGAGPQQQLGLKTLEVVVPAEDILRFLRAGEKIVARRAGDGEDADAGGNNQKPGRAQSQPAPAPASHKRKPNDAVDGDTESHRRLRRRLAGCGADEGWEWRRRRTGSAAEEEEEEEGGSQPHHQHQPFTEALAAYLAAHLGLDLFHPGVRIQRVACAGFVAAEPGRVRVARSPSRPASRSSPDLDSGSHAEEEDGGGPAWNLIRKLIAKAGGGGGGQWGWSASAVKMAQLAAAAAP